MNGQDYDYEVGFAAQLADERETHSVGDGCEPPHADAEEAGCAHVPGGFYANCQAPDLKAEVARLTTLSQSLSDVLGPHLTGDCDAALRERLAAVRWALARFRGAASTHFVNCPAGGVSGTLPCDPRCKQARAALEAK